MADGMGETDSITVFHGIGAHLIRRATHPIGSSLGILYGALTHYLGFLFDDLFVRPAAGDMERPRRGSRRDSP